jgi:hypothetical protein
MTNDFFFSDDDKPEEDAAMFLPLVSRLLLKGILKRRLWWLNHRQPLLKRKRLPLLQSVRKGEQQRLLLSRFIGLRLLLLIM